MINNLCKVDRIMLLVNKVGVCVCVGASHTHPVTAAAQTHSLKLCFISKQSAVTVVMN